MNNIRIGRRLQVAFGLMLLITVLIAGIGMSRLGTLGSASQHLVDVAMQRSLLAQRWDGNINLNWVRAASSLVSGDADYIASLQKEMTATSAAISEVQKQLEALMQVEKGLSLMAEVAKRRTAYTDARAKLLDRKKSGEDMGAAVARDLRPLADSYLGAVANVRQHADALSAEVTKSQVYLDRRRAIEVSGPVEGTGLDIP